MVFILAVRPRLLYIANRQIQSNKRLISSSTQKLLQSSNTLSNASKVNRQVTEKTNKFFKKRHVALVSGIIIIGSYISFNQSNYYNLDTVPPIGGGGRSRISPKLFPPSNTTVIGDD